MDRLVMGWVQMSIVGRPVVTKVIHAVLHSRREEGWSRTSVDVAIKVLKHKVGELEDAEDVAWDW